MTSAAPPPPPDPLIGRVLDGRYRIEAFVARGGMATVYRGADLRLDRTVAVKVMHPSFATDPGFVERFEREARAAARLSSPYVVGVHDQGTDAGLTYLVMEYVPGHTVRDVLRTHGPLPPAQALAIVDPVLEALAAAHRAGYIHRDVKPENVLISDDGRVKVTDFGLARAIEGADSGKTHGLLLGTVAYLSPEQVEHDRTDARSDVYGAGILLFELVTGQVPFSASAPMQVAYKHVHEDVPAPSSVRAGVPAEVDALVQRATRRQPDARFPDADAFLHAVRDLRRSLPPAQPWSPAPNDTLVVARPEPPAPAAEARPAPGSGARAAGAAAAGVAGAMAGAGAAGLVADATRSERPGWQPGVGEGAPQAGPGSGSGDAQDGHATTVSAATAAADPRQPRRRHRGRWLAAVALLSVVGVVFLVLGPMQRVGVPNVLGMTPTEATAVLATANLKLDASQTDYSEDFQKGQIMATDPGPDSSARSGSTISATVSKGPERYDVPDLEGRTLAQAEEALAEVKMTLGTQTQDWHDTIDEGDIVSTDPPAGQTVKPGTVVNVTVSKGPKPVDLPDLVGASADSATATLKDLGLKVKQSRKSSESVAAGNVISMDPKSGTTVYRGDTVSLVVSSGPPLVTVPDVVGKTEAAARSALQKAGFQVQVNYPLRFNLLDRVRTQTPKAQAKAPKGSTIRIDVV